MTLALLSAITTAPATPLRGQALIDEISKRTVKYFREQSHPDTGFALDRGPNFKEGYGGDTSSIASTGYAIGSFAIAAKRGWMTRADAKKRSLNILRNVYKKGDQVKGWYYHFVDWKTGKRNWNSEVSSIDSAILFANILMAEQAWKDKEFSRLSKLIFKRVDWKWMLTDGGAKPDSLSFTMGYTPEHGFINARWDSYNELMALYIMAMGASDDVPASCWDNWKRPVIEYEGLELFVGGPLFLHQEAQGWIDFKGKRDRLGYDYWVNSRNATLANRLYCIKNPKGFKGYSATTWGLSACDIPTGYGAKGAPGWIDDDGTLAPACAVASMMFTPELSMQAAEGFVKDLPDSWGRYGFTTGINPSQNWRSDSTLGLDIGQMILGIEVARDGLPHKWMMSHPIVQKGMKKAGFRVTSEGPLTSRKLQVTN